MDAGALIVAMLCWMMACLIAEPPCGARAKAGPPESRATTEKATKGVASLAVMVVLSPRLVMQPRVAWIRG